MKKFSISSSPHMQSKLSTPQIMWGVIVALIPAFLASVYFFKWFAIKLILVCIVSCVVTEAVIRAARGKKSSISDGSAVVTGILLAMILPPTEPL